MNQPVPAGDRFDRAALERIMRRAAELQAGERDLSEGLSESELFSLASEVGIPKHHLQQAIAEEGSRAVLPAEGGFLGSLIGPRRIAARRAIPRSADDVETALNHWMAESELLAVKRRFTRAATWEPRQDLFSAVKRSLGSGGRRFDLARAREVGMIIADLEPGRCLVTLTADLSNTSAQHLTGATLMGASGGAFTLIGTAIGVTFPIALLPLALGLGAGVAVAASRKGRVERMHIALEQILDRLERGEIRAPVDAPRQSLIGRLADEIRKGLDDAGRRGGEPR